MAIDILMPALSPTMETGTLASWNMGVGDAVRSGDVIAEIETDKATMEVEAVDDGVLAVILVAAGTENVAVGTPIARLAEDGEAVDAVAAAPVATVAAPKTEAPAEKAADPAAAPAAPAPAPTAAVQPSSSASGAPRLFASPLARRIAGDNGVDIAALSGSGPHGRILRRDVEAAMTAPAEGPAGITAARVDCADALLSVMSVNSRCGDLSAKPRVRFASPRAG